MLRARLISCAILAFSVVASSCARAQEGVDAGAPPLDLRPRAQAQKSVPQGPLKPAAAKSAPVKVVAKPKSASKKKQGAPKHPQPVPSGAHEDVAEKAVTPAPLVVKAAAVAEKPAEKPPVAEPPKPVEARPPFDEMVVARFCNTLSSAASDGRLAWEAKRLQEMEERLRARIAELEAKRAEAADWLKRREEAQRMADETVVAIYAKMKPDAAAAQFSAMDEAGAAAILSKLNPRAAGIVLNEIDPARAARIAAEMAGVGPRREAARSTP